MKKSIYHVCALFLFALLSSLSSCHDVNCLPDSHFTEDGHLKEPIDSAIEMSLPSKVKFFMEASGSMNGLYRPECKSEFRDDVFQIVSYYLTNNDNVYTLCEDRGRAGLSYSLPNFAIALQHQGFPSMGSTSITDMMETVIQNIDTARNQVGVLISDMKFDPDGLNNIDYQLGMYTTKVSSITAESNLAFSLVAATSKYYNAKGIIIAEESPYYYLIMGKTENVAKVRDDISTMLLKNGNYVDNIETGMAYGGTNFSVEKVRNCIKMRTNPSFVDVDPSEPCRINLKIHLENYRWALACKENVLSSFNCNMLHGASVSIDSVTIDSAYVDDNKNLHRSMEASIFLNIRNLQTDCDVLEWTFNPCSVDNKLEDFSSFCGAFTWQDYTKTFSIENFIQGFFRAARLNTCSKKSNYILISTHSE